MMTAHPLHLLVAGLSASPAAASLPAPSEAASAVVVAAYFSALGILALFGLHRAWLTAIVLRHRRALPPDPKAPADWPAVTVQCPIYNEPDVAARLIDAVCSLDYPRDRLEIQVLDDSTDDTRALVDARVASHREAGIDVKAVRRPTREGYKAGALDHGLSQASGELLAIFDADFVPERDFLVRTVPSFDDPRVGLVQARWGHLNRRRSWLTRVQGLLLDGHFLIEHAARALSGRFFNFNGTAGIFRRSCIDEAGGWQHDTLTEDLDLSYRAQLAGWRFAYRPDVIAPAELPTEINAWKSQQRRWTQGSVQSARKLLGPLLRSALPARVKLEAVVHLTNNVAYPLLLLLALTTLPAALVRRSWGWGPLVGIELPLLLATTGAIAVFFLVASRRDRAPLTDTLVVLPWLFAIGVGSALNSTRAVIAGLRRDVGEFVRTPKSGDDTAPGTALPRARYRFGPDAWAWMEVGLGLLLAVEAVWAAQAALWPTLPFLVLFASGFLAVGAGSLAERIAAVSWRNQPKRGHSSSPA